MIILTLTNPFFNLRSNSREFIKSLQNGQVITIPIRCNRSQFTHSQVTSNANGKRFNSTTDQSFGSCHRRNETRRNSIGDG